MRERIKPQMGRRILYLLAGIFLTASGTAGQEKIALSGYLSNMTAGYHIPDQWLWENSLHNRLNLDLYPTDWLTASVQIRNRFITAVHQDVTNVLSEWRASGLTGGQHMMAGGFDALDEHFDIRRLADPFDALNANEFATFHVSALPGDSF